LQEATLKMSLRWQELRSEAYWSAVANTSIALFAHGLVARGAVSHAALARISVRPHWEAVRRQCQEAWDNTDLKEDAGLFENVDCSEDGGVSTEQWLDFLKAVHEEAGEACVATILQA